MGRAEDAIRSRLHPGQRLLTPVRAAPFEVAEIRPDALVLLLGASKARTVLRWELLEAALVWLDQRGWVEVGARFDGSREEPTLDGFIKRYISRAAANYITAVLVTVSLAEVDSGRPIRTRSIAARRL